MCYKAIVAYEQNKEFYEIHSHEVSEHCCLVYIFNMSFNDMSHWESTVLRINSHGISSECSDGLELLLLIDLYVKNGLSFYK